MPRRAFTSADGISRLVGRRIVSTSPTWECRYLVCVRPGLRLAIATLDAAGRIISHALTGGLLLKYPFILALKGFTFNPRLELDSVNRGQP